MQYHLLLVDDDPLVAQLLKAELPEQWRLSVVEDDDVALPLQLHAAFVDLHLTGQVQIAEGLEIIRKLRLADPHLEIIAV